MGITHLLIISVTLAALLPHSNQQGLPPVANPTIQQKKENMEFLTEEDFQAKIDAITRKAKKLDIEPTLLGNACPATGKCRCEDGSRAKRVKVPGDKKRSALVCVPDASTKCAPNIRCQCCSDFLGALNDERCVVADFCRLGLEIGETCTTDIQCLTLTCDNGTNEPTYKCIESDIKKKGGK